MLQNRFEKVNIAVEEAKCEDLIDIRLKFKSKIKDSVRRWGTILSPTWIESGAAKLVLISGSGGDFTARQHQSGVGKTIKEASVRTLLILSSFLTRRKWMRCSEMGQKDRLS